MLNFKSIWPLVSKDFRESLRNKTILIVLILPLAASLVFNLIGQSEGLDSLRLGITEKELAQYISEQLPQIDTIYFSSLSRGREELDSGRLDGLLSRGQGGEASENRNNLDIYQLYINSGKPTGSLLLKEALSEVLPLYLHIRPAFKLEMIPSGNQNGQNTFLPLWMTVTMTMIGVLIMSGNLAEEKDNRTLDVLLISPASELEILIGKGITGLILIVLTLGLMVIFNGITNFTLNSLMLILLLILSGSLGLTALGLLLGAAAGSQATARSLGTVIYFPLLFPVFAGNISGFTRKLAHILPTYYLQDGLERVIHFQAGFREIWVDIVFLLGFSLLVMILTLAVFKRQSQLR